MVESISRSHPPSRLLLTLALVSAVVVPQLGVSMSVPSLPSIAHEIGVSISTAQGTLIIYMAGYALSMLAAGLLSDRFGPRQIQLWGLAVASGGAVLAAISHDITTFYVARFIQALGGCVGTVTARLIVSKEYETHDRMKILTTLASAIAITPCLAPLAGGALLPYVGWRGVFVTIAAISLGTLVFFMVASRTIAPHVKHVVSLSNVGTIYLRNLHMPRFALYATAISFVWMSYFTFVSVSSGPLQIHMGLSAFHYGVVLGLAAVGYVAGSITARKLSRSRDIDMIIRSASIVGLFGGVLLVAAAILFPDYLISILFPVTIILFSTGMIIPATQAGLLRYVTKDAGVSSGLFFFLQMIAGAAYAGLGNIWHDMTPRVLAILVAVPAILLPFAFHALTSRVRRKEDQESRARRGSLYSG